MRALRFIPIILIFMANLIQGQNWQKALDRVNDKLVIIEFYEQHASMEAMEEKSRIKRTLTGLIVDEDGLVLTSASIFKPVLEFSGAPSFHYSNNLPSDIRVRTIDGQYHPAAFVGKDDDKGLGFIRISDKLKITPLKLVDNKGLNIGDELLIIQRLGLRYNHQPVISQRRINAIIRKPQPYYLCENNLMAGAGFALALDSRNNPVGILSGDYQTDPFFGDREKRSSEPLKILPYAQFKALIESPPVFRQKESTRKKWLGVYMQPYTRAMAAYFGSDSIEGVLLNTIIPESPAERAGLQIGDVVTAIDGHPLSAEKTNDLDIFRDLIRGRKDSLAVFSVYRDGALSDVNIILDETPISQFLAEEESNPTLGFSVKELTQDIILGQQLDFETQGVWVSRVERAGWADIAGLGIGDLIQNINDQPIDGLDAIRKVFSQIEEKKPGYIQLFIRRNGGTSFLYIKTNYDKTGEE